METQMTSLSSQKQSNSIDVSATYTPGFFGLFGSGNGLGLDEEPEDWKPDFELFWQEIKKGEEAIRKRGVVPANEMRKRLGISVQNIKKR